MKLAGHMSRVGSLTYNGDSLASGSRDQRIHIRDLRTPTLGHVLTNHNAEIGGLKWAMDKKTLASGGGDRVFVWDLAQISQPIQTYTHKAPIRAVAWSPHTRGLLATGGGLKDRFIHFWNTATIEVANQ